MADQDGDSRGSGSSDSLTVAEADSQLMAERIQSSSYSDEVSQGPSTPVRATWGGQLEFILTCIGYAVGLGNVWRFPYLAYRNGGAIFLIPYVLMLALVGLPIFFLEFAFGQFASLGPITIWKLNPVMKGLGYCMVITSWLIALYYNVIIAHTLFFLGASFTSELPWGSCGNYWNTPGCLSVLDSSAPATSVANATSTNSSTEYAMVGHLTNLTNSNVTFTNTSFPANTTNTTAQPTYPVFTSTEEYYYNHVLQQSDSIDNMGPVSWQLGLCLFFAWVIVTIVLIKGVTSLGKVVYFTAIFPYVMLTVLLIRGLTLDGALDGIYFYLFNVQPDVAREVLSSARVWSDAATQIFYSLGTCSGGLIAMASYNKFHNNCCRDSLIVALINCGTSIYAGLVIFSVLGFMAHEKGLPVDKVAKGGPGLAFIVYPEALARMPVAPLWSVFFFIMMATLGFGSQFSLVECVLSAFTDEFPKYLMPRKNNIIFRLAVCASMFLLGLPMVTQGGIYLLNLIDFSVSGFPLLVAGVGELIAINWVYGFWKFSEDVRMMLGVKPNIYWVANWVAISPVIILLLIVFNCAKYVDPSYGDGTPYPPWACSLGWCIALFPILCIPVYAVGYYMRYGGFDLLRFNMLPLSDWGPAQEKHREGTEYAYSKCPSAAMEGGSHTGSRLSVNRWNTDNFAYISSVRSMLMKKAPSEASATESQLALSETQTQEQPAAYLLVPQSASQQTTVPQTMDPPMPYDSLSQQVLIDVLCPSTGDTPESLSLSSGQVSSVPGVSER